MTRINTNVTALISSRYLNQNNFNLNTSLERLSTGYRINRGSDDPAGLIASENLRSDMAGIKSALVNAQRANSVVSTAEGALAEVSDLLIDLQGLTAQSANTGGLTTEEIEANQLQVDGIIGSVNRIASQTSFTGKRLLDGSMGFQADALASNTKITDIAVNAAKTGGVDMDLVVTIDTAAASAGATQAVGVVACAGTDTSVTYEIAGKKGSATFTFADGASAQNIKDAINAASSITGLAFSVERLASTDLTAADFVRVEIVAGSDTTGLLEQTVYGTDAVVNINGMEASIDGYNAKLRTANLDIDFTMTDALVNADLNTDTITIVADGGATFQISQNVGYVGQEIIGLQSVYATRLGSATTGYLSDVFSGGAKDLKTDARGAQEIISAAIKRVSTMRGRLGSFLKDTVQTTMNSLNVAYENVAAADAAIRETDFATETAALTRNQILVNASTSVLSMANAAPQSVLALLG